MAAPWWRDGNAADAKEYGFFWSDAVLYGDFARFVLGGNYVSVAKSLIYKTHWWGRFADMSDEEFPTDEYGVCEHPGVTLFEELSQDAIDHLTSLSYPPIVIEHPDDEVKHGHNAWLNKLYHCFQPQWERHEYAEDYNHPILKEPAEWYEVVGLACGVFLASARAIELFADKELEGAPTTSKREPKGAKAEVFILTPLQKAILKALDGKALKKDPLADECKIDPTRLYRPGGIKELRANGLVKTLPGIGYYRPNAPPPEAVELNIERHGSQGTTSSPPSGTN